MDNSKLVKASMLIDRANKELEKAGGDMSLLNKEEYRASLREAKLLILKSIRATYRKK